MHVESYNTLYMMYWYYMKYMYTYSPPLQSYEFTIKCGDIGTVHSFILLLLARAVG